MRVLIVDQSFVQSSKGRVRLVVRLKAIESRKDIFYYLSSYIHPLAH